MLPNSASSSSRSAAIRSGARSPDLLYVSNRKDGSVDFYVLATEKLQGRLSNVRASGLCANGNGAVFMTNGHEVLEYAHGGTRAVAVLRDLLGAPLQGCAADASSGDLAVTSSAGRIAIFANAKGSARALNDPGRYSAIAYDDSGNLFVAGAHAVKELSQGATALRAVVWSGPRRARVGAMQWDGRYLAIENAPSTKTAVATVSRYAVNGTHLTFVDSIALASSAAPLRFAVLGEQLFAPATAGVAQYGYPQGGRATTVFADALEPQDVAVSRASQPKFALTTYHDDNYRTGWDNDESALTEKTVNSTSFGLLASVSLDDQVDAQPLVVPDVTSSVVAGQHATQNAVRSADSRLLERLERKRQPCAGGGKRQSPRREL